MAVPPVMAIEHLPEMVNIPAGTFEQGCVTGKMCDPDELPVKKVKIKPFSIGKYEITFDQWDECYEAKECDHKPDDAGWGRGNRPVINVSYKDIQKYLDWLSKATGVEYRLPTESEWEYAARAGTKTIYSWSNQPPGCSNKRNNGAHFDGGEDSPCSTKNKKGTVSVGQYRANPWKLHDIHGNVWEVTSECYSESYKPGEFKNCNKRVIRGGAWSSTAIYLRLSNRGRVGTAKRSDNIGFRVASKPMSRNVISVKKKKPLPPPRTRKKRVKSKPTVPPEPSKKDISKTKSSPEPSKENISKPKSPPESAKEDISKSQSPPEPGREDVSKIESPPEPSKEDLFKAKLLAIIKANNKYVGGIAASCRESEGDKIDALIAGLKMEGKDLITDLYNIAHTSDNTLKEYLKKNQVTAQTCSDAIDKMSSFLQKDHANSLLTELRANMSNED